MTSTMTISLPRELERRARVLAHAQHRSMSELFREALRVYEVTGGYWNAAPGESLEWKKLRAALTRISRQGRKRSLTEFLARDRMSH